MLLKKKKFQEIDSPIPPRKKRLLFSNVLTFQAQAKFVVESFLIFSVKISLDISCESSAKQKVHLKCQDFIFFEK